MRAILQVRQYCILRLMRKIFLLTGATGFLGSNLLRALACRGHKIVAFKRDQSNQARIQDIVGDVIWHNISKTEIESAFQQYHFDAIIHCATDYGRKSVRPLQTLEANLFLPLNLLEYAREYRVSTFINSDTILDKRINDYALSKKHFSEWLETYSSDLCCINIALEHFFGPADDPSKFVTSIIISFLRDAPEILLTSGEQKRDFVYIDDVITAFILLIGCAQDLGFGFHRFEVGTGEPVRIRDFVEITKRVANNVHTRLGFGELPYRENEVMESCAHLEALYSMGWEPRVSLEEGLARTIAYERSQIICTT